MSTSTTLGDPARRVPVEHRLLGLDRRSIPYAAVALLVYALWAWVLPWIDDQVAWDDPVLAGEAIQVTPEVTMTPPPGWGVVSGLRTDDSTDSGATASGDGVVLVKDGISLVIQTGPYDGSPASLLEQVDAISTSTTPRSEFRALTGARPTTTSGGLRGVVEGYQSQRLAGVEAAFVVEKTGIKIQVTGSPDQMSKEAATIGQMLDSLATTTGGSSS